MFKTYDNRKTNIISKNTYNSDLYLNTYCGAYLNNDGNLSIMIKNDENFQTFADKLDETIVKYVYGKYSKAELLNTMEIISQVFKTYNINKSSLDEEENLIHISLYDNKTKDKFITFLKDKNIDVNCLIFDKEIDESMPTKGYQSGNYLSFTGDGSCTVGFNAYLSAKKQYGLVSAGHAYVEDYLYTTKSGNVINNGTNSYYIYGGKVDAMFLPFHAPEKWDPTASYVKYENNVASLVGKIVKKAPAIKGFTVGKYGIKSGVTSGKILRTAVDGYYTEGPQYKDYFETECENMVGDSGGPVGYEKETGTQKELSLVGIICCGVTTNGSTHKCCKIYNICDMFGLEL